MKDGVVNTLEKTFVYLGYSPHMKLKTLMECFKYFTASSKYPLKIHQIGLFPKIKIYPHQILYAFYHLKIIN